MSNHLIPVEHRGLKTASANKNHRRDFLEFSWRTIPAATAYALSFLPNPRTCLRVFLAPLLLVLTGCSDDRVREACIRDGGVWIERAESGPDWSGFPPGCYEAPVPASPDADREG